MMNGIIITKEEAQDVFESITLTLNQKNLTEEYKVLLNKLQKNLRIAIINMQN